MAEALVIGASGLVGGALVREGARRGVDLVGTYAHARAPGLVHLDATDAEAVRELLETLRPAWVMMPAANPNVELCETEPELTRRTNVEAVATVAAGCRRVGAGLAFFSSDYVFDGSAGPYRETDPTSPICEYGRQKLEAEGAVLDTLPECGLIVRTTVVYGLEARGKNFAYRLVRSLRAGETVKVPFDQIGNPTLVDELAEAVWALVERGRAGVFHLAGPTLVSRYDFALALAAGFGLSTEGVVPVSTAELRQVAPRPLSAGLVCHKAEAEIGPRFSELPEAVEKFRGQGGL